MVPIFDDDLRARRRDRAARTGVELFLLERTFLDCLERIGDIAPDPGPALLVGCPDAAWPKRLRAVAQSIDVADPGALFAARAGGRQIVEDEFAPPVAHYALIVAIGTLDTVNNFPLALRILREALVPGGLLIGAVSGGDTLPRLRAAMAAADRVAGAAAPRIHPRIEAASMAPLLEQAGLVRPVIDIDRASVRYRSFDRLVADLRGMGATNVLRQRSRKPLTRAARAAAAASFSEEGDDGGTVETVEIIHFSAWRTPSAQ